MSQEEIVHCLAQTLQFGVAVEHPLVVLALYVVQSLGLVGQLIGILCLLAVMQLIILAVAHKDSAVRSQLGQNVLYVEADKGLGNDRPPLSSFRV